MKYSLDKIQILFYFCFLIVHFTHVEIYYLLLGYGEVIMNKKLVIMNKKLVKVI